MHTGFIIHFSLGHISKREIDKAESLQTRLTANEQRIRLYINEGTGLKMLVSIKFLTY